MMYEANCINADISFILYTVSYEINHAYILFYTNIK